MASGNMSPKSPETKSMKRPETFVEESEFLKIKDMLR